MELLAASISNLALKFLVLFSYCNVNTGFLYLFYLGDWVGRQGGESQSGLHRRPTGTSHPEKPFTGSQCWDTQGQVWRCWHLMH